MKRNFAVAAAVVALAVVSVCPVSSQTAQPRGASGNRERWLMDFGWHFALGNATDPAKDFDPSPASNTFSYFAKAGDGQGAAATDFDDRGWRTVNLPHDWAVELPFDSRGSGSHGYKAIGRNFPENSVGWYRKSFNIPNSDLGKQISIEFDGVFRDSIVWVNGFYLGREASGYTSFTYNLTDYLNYGGNNVIAVRVDASLEEGWFYEGAGIYRHVWLTKTAPLHVAHWGTFVTSEVGNNSAAVTARATIANEGTSNAGFIVGQTVLDSEGKSVASETTQELSLAPDLQGDFTNLLTVANPNLWSPETPYLYKLITTVSSGGVEVDRYETPFGIRTIRFDADKGFFLNGQHVELKGTCDHQDAAGVGVAVPDELNAWRVAQLKKMGSNAIRTSHNPPTPELLDACDRLGMMVMDENRSEGINTAELGELKSLMLRDRNHPCVVIWSLGNEEWSIESNDKGTRVTQTMQTLAQTLDPTRRFTEAISGGWGGGSSVSIDIMGFNYYTHGDNPENGNDDYHSRFPRKPSVATEEGSTFSTRGIYVADQDHQHLTAYDENKPNWGLLAEESWPHYAARPYVAGLFTWTGFDYRGEETPFNWPAINSQFGILDTCGFPKDNFYYYQSWYADRPVLHLFPHWNWPGKEGQPINVWCYGNCEEVELFLNGQSLGRKTMPTNSHLAWAVSYAPGVLLARGYKGGQEIITDKVETTGDPASVQLSPHKSTLLADGEDVAVVTVQVNDAQGRPVATAANEIAFAIAGPGKIIGVGNGDPSSHEPDQYVAQVVETAVAWRRLAVDGVEDRPEVAADFDDSTWQAGFGARGGRGGGGRRGGNGGGAVETNVFRGTFEVPDPKAVGVSLLLRDVGEDQWIYLNGQSVAENVARNPAGHEFDFDSASLRPGKNVIAIVATPLAGGRRGRGGQGGQVASNPAVVKVVAATDGWKRSLFSGLAQVIVQSTGQAGEITLTGTSAGLAPGVLRLESQTGPPRLSVAAQ